LIQEVAVETNVKILGWLYVVLGILGVLAGIAVLVILLGTGLIANDRTAFSVLAIVGVVVAAIVTIVSAPGIAAGFGLLAFRQWGRILALIVGFLNLFNFPLGTALGVYTFVSLLNPDAEILFSRH
jgi:hypothetical protein